MTQRGHFELQALDADGLCVECEHQPDTCDCAERLADEPYDRQREEHSRDLLRAWADAAANAGCPPAFVARMRTFADMHDRHAQEADR